MINPRYKCCVTGKVLPRGLFGENIVSSHHYIKQQHYKKNKKWFDDNGIKQKVMWLRGDIHSSLHSAMNDKRFFEKYGVERDKLLFNKREYLERTVHERN